MRAGWQTRATESIPSQAQCSGSAMRVFVTDLDETVTVGPRIVLG